MKKTNQIIYLLILSLNQISLFGQGTGEMFPFSSYKEFDLEGGYYPGSFLVVKKKSAQAPILTRERLDQLVCKKKLLEYSKPLDVPNTTLDRTKTFQTSLDVGVKYQGIDPEVKGQLQKAKNITLNVKKGKRYFIGSGTIAIQDVIYALPLEELTKIKFELANKRKVFMIAEVIEYEEAELEFKWDNAIEAGLKVQIPQVVKLGTDNKWTDNATLIVKFAPGQLIGYKAVEIGKSYKKLIEERIKFRQSNGDDKCMYIDNDKDGYGDANSECKGIPTNSLAQFPNYVENNRDCYDENPNVHPGQTGFFTAPRGDGSELQYDYNCDRVIELEFPSNGKCQGKNGCGEALQGWNGKIPRPGADGEWIKDCDYKVGYGCVMEKDSRKQGGR